MNRTARLQSAKATKWIEKYAGKNIIRGYCKWFAVDPLCAVIELRELGVRISAEEEEKLRRSAENKSLARKQKTKEVESDIFGDSDDTFAYIAGVIEVMRKTCLNNFLKAQENLLLPLELILIKMEFQFL